MEALKLDFLSDGHSAWVGIVTLVVGLAGALFTVWSYHEESQKISQQEILIASIRRERSSILDTQPIEKDSEQIAVETNQAKAIILELNLPWRELFEAIESYQKNDVAVLAIEPDAQKGLVRVNAEAKSLDNMITYLAYLQKLPLFRNIELVNHQIQEQDPQQPVRFMLQATWGVRP